MVSPSVVLLLVTFLRTEPLFLHFASPSVFITLNEPSVCQAGPVPPVGEGKKPNPEFRMFCGEHVVVNLGHGDKKGIGLLGDKRA